MLTLVIWMKSLLTVGKQSRGYLTVLGISHQRGVEGRGQKDVGRGQKDVGEESEGCGGGGHTSKECIFCNGGVARLSH